MNPIVAFLLYAFCAFITVLLLRVLPFKILEWIQNGLRKGLEKQTKEPSVDASIDAQIAHEERLERNEQFANWMGCGLFLLLLLIGFFVFLMTR